MKILQVIPYFYPAWAYGGSPRNTYGLCQELVKRGHNVTVFTTDALDGQDRIKETYEVVNGIEIRRFRNLNNYIAYRHRLFFSSGMVSAMRNDLKKYDIVHMNEYRTLQNVLTYHYALKYDVPYIMQARGSLVNVIAKQKLKSLFDYMWGRRILKDASRLIAVSPLEVEQYKEQGVSQENIEVIPNGIDLTEFDNLPQRGIFRKKYGLENNRIILFLGRIHEIKGLDLLIKAFSGLVKECDDAKLVIAGSDDGYLATLKRLIMEYGLEDKVIFTGLLVGEQKLSAYVDADVYVLPSSYEIFGVTILEALACETPVVITDCCGLADVIRDKAGLVVPRNIVSLRKALEEMLVNNSKRQQYGKAGKDLVWQNYGWANIAEQVEKVYKSMV